jgi:hypothetical protein
MMSSELRAAMTWASAPGGLASWSTAMDSDIHGPDELDCCSRLADAAC